MSYTGIDTDCTIFVIDNWDISNVHKYFDLLVSIRIRYTEFDSFAESAWTRVCR